jgi:uncharacterized membrane-anchored protein YjiN (DUF445 family)
MKTTAIVTSFWILCATTAAGGFVPGHAPFMHASVATKSKIDKMRDEIQHELNDLGQEIEPQVLGETKGFEYTESLIHKLRHELHERDVKYQKEIKELKKSMDGLAVMINAEEVVIRDYKEENESVRRLLSELAKLVGRRIRKRVNGLLRFLRLKKRD